MTLSPVRIAMWSGPRNISTAMMRAWGNRSDTAVIDEPLYAYYLEKTAKPHPGAAEIVAQGETDLARLITEMTKEAIPGGNRVFFQKQMTHHLLPEISRQWVLDLTNCFLIRDPREVILSYIKKNPDPVLEDLGFVQQHDLFCLVQGQTKSIPPIVDAADVLQNPERMLQILCEAIGVPFDKAMLSWPSGLRETDGIWARHWYDAVAKSTSFEPYRPKPGKVPDSLSKIYEKCLECYEQLHECRLN